jgi:type III pantothenate kinase
MIQHDGHATRPGPEDSESNGAGGARDQPTIVAVNVGNSRTSFALCRGSAVEAVHTMANDEVDKVAAAIRAAVASGDEHAPSVLGSVNHAFRDRLINALHAAGCETIKLGIGEHMPIPMNHTLTDEGIRGTGQDRLLNALAAFEMMNSACVVVDAGTAITVDFVDGEGTFHGGAIAAGASMSLRALHGGTSALPELAFDAPDDEPFGRDTKQAMLQGVTFGARGLVRLLLERYSEKYGAYPRVVATGGDAERLFEGDELIERIVPDLTLRGIAAAAIREAQAE